MTEVAELRLECAAPWPQHSGGNPWRCKRRSPRHRPLPPARRSADLFPFLQPINHLLVRNALPLINLAESLLHFLEHVQPVLHVLERAVVRQLFEDLLDMFFRGHGEAIVDKLAAMSNWK